MRKSVLVLLFVLMISGISYAVINDTKASGSTVTYSTVANVISFNSATNWMYFRNESVVSDAYVNLRNDKSTLIGDAVLKLPAYGTQTPNTVELKFSTNGIVVISDRVSAANSAGNRISYTVTGDRGDF